ncbi:MAG: protein kinase [Deltaproteobacteria bacterium]|nr:protein kinase [Deltaproteobacteria bacterium]
MSQILLANRYRVIEELGRGGMGVVFRVVDTLNRNQVLALKTIRSERSFDEALRLRFKAEFHTMARLRHPNTVLVTDFAQLDERTHYFTMEYVEGESLDGLMARGRLKIEEVARYTVQLLQALQFIHARLFVHRDIKPANLRITSDGVLKLMDFGLIQQLGLRASGKIEGTLGYMPPEVFLGGVLNATSDLYSVGCVLFEMLAGRLPFVGSAADLRASARRPAPPVRAFRPDAPPQLEAIVARLLEKDPSRRYGSARAVIEDLCALAGLGRAGESPEQRASYLITASIVGRDRELALLREALAATRAGEARSIFVGAPAGVGKSRLVNELVLSAKLDEMLVLQARCVDDNAAPYEVVAQALRPLIPLTSAQAFASWGPALARSLPELADQGVAAAPPLPAGQEKARFQAAVLAWLGEITQERPLLLFVDDLQWCDRPSMEVLNACIRELRAKPILVLGTFRSNEAPPSSPVWHTIGEGHTCHLQLDALDLPRTTQLVAAMLPGLHADATLMEALQRSTGGNAFFVTEALRYLIEVGAVVASGGQWRLPGGLTRVELPGSVEHTIRCRLERLGVPALELAQVSAVIAAAAPRLDCETLLSVSQVGEEDLLSALDELIEHQVLYREAAEYAFAHDRMREVLYSDLSAARREELHQRCGEHLEARTTSGGGVGSSALAHHFGRGRDVLRAFCYARRAGDEARIAGQEGVALAWWQQADRSLQAVAPPDKEAQQFALWWDIGSVGSIPAPLAAAAALEKCIRMLEERKDLPGLAPGSPEWVRRRCESYLSLCIASSGNPRRGIPSGRRALELLPERGSPLEAGTRVALGACFNAAGRIDEMREEIRKAQRIYAGMEPAKLGAHESMGFVGRDLVGGFVTLQGYRFDAAAAESCERVAETLRLQSICVPGLRLAQAAWFALTGRHDEAMARLDDVAQTLRNSGAPPLLLAMALYAITHAQREEWEEALAVDRQARELAEPNFPPAFLMLDVVVARAQLEQGRREAGEVEKLLETTLQRSLDQEIYLPAMQALVALGDVAARQQRWDAARRRFEEAHALCAEGIARNPLYQAIAARRLGDVALAVSGTDSAGREAAYARYQEALAIVIQPEQDNLIEQGRTLRAIGEWHQAGGDAAAARQAWEEAARLFTAIRNPAELRRVEGRLQSLGARATPPAACEFAPARPGPGQTLIGTRDDESPAANGRPAGNGGGESQKAGGS